MEIKKIPQGFALCINDECKMATSCTRNILYRHLPADIDTVTILNPQAQVQSQESCPKYHEYRQVRNAYGFKKLYNSLPVGNSEFFWTRIPQIGSESTYYRMKRGQIAISPELQQQILAIAKQCGAPDDIDFDSYRQEIAFS